MELYDRLYYRFKVSGWQTVTQPVHNENVYRMDAWVCIILKQIYICIYIYCIYHSFNINGTLNFPVYNPNFPLIFLVLSRHQQSVALLLTPSSVTMSFLDTAASFAYPSSTLFHAQNSRLDLLVTPEQKLVKSTCSFLRKRLSPTLRASDSAFVKRVYRLTYTLLLILLLCSHHAHFGHLCCRSSTSFPSTTSVSSPRCP